MVRWLLFVWLLGCGPATPPVGPHHDPSGPGPLVQGSGPGPAIAIDPGACGPARSVEVLPASENGGSAKVFPRGNGLDLFWTRVSRGQDEARFDLMHAELAADGALRTRPRSVFASPGRHMVAGEGGTYGLVYQRSTKDGWAGRVVAARGDRILWDVGLPNRNRGHGTMAIGWDPRARQWVVVGEELFQMPNQPTGYVFNRLFVARFDERGTAVAPLRYLTEPTDSASLSDWGNPMVWAGDRHVFAWQLTKSGGGGPFVTELAGSTVKHIPIPAKSLSRGVVAATAAGYVVAGGEACGSSSGTLCSRVFVTTVRAGVAAPIRYLSDQRMHATEAVIASDGTRVGIAWHESDLTTGRNRGSTVHAATIDANGTITEVARSKPAPDQHDWVQSIAWTGCQFVLAHTNGINPSSIQLVTFP